MRKKNIAFALAMAAMLNVSVSELVNAQSAFVDDFKAEKEGRV